MTDFERHVRRLETQALAGDLDAVRSLCCIALAAGGTDGEDQPVAIDDGCDVIDLSAYLRVAA